ncbi:hypothetical protein [Nocardioides sp.]|uniref:hypothetical protein n=1 Tax=Nocardioides sp. TaxID=35761 RepID=UPI0025D4D6D2|nr:hypothetical protein [Nocardioides sp.]
MGSANSEGTTESSLDLLQTWLVSDEREPGLAVIEDLTVAALPVLLDTSRQSDPAAVPPPPEGGESSDARGPAGAAQAAPVTVAPIDLSLQTGNRRVVGFLLFAVAVLAVLQTAVAYADPGVVTLGLAVVLAALTVAAWRSWAGHSPTTVLLVGSHLEIVRDGGRHVFDLADPRLPVDVVGLVGDRSWRVEFSRRGMAPYVLDATMVDPAELLLVLHRHRSEVRYRPR